MALQQQIQHGPTWWTAAMLEIHKHTCVFGHFNCIDFFVIYSLSFLVILI